MGESRRRLTWNFQAKVLVPVVTVLVVFVAATLWLFSSRVELQLRSDAEVQRASFQNQFTNSLAQRANTLVAALKSRVEQPDFRSTPTEQGKRLKESQSEISDADLASFNATMNPSFEKLLETAGEEGVIALFVFPGGKMARFTRGPVDAGAFEAAAAPSIEAVFEQISSDERKIECENKLYDVVSMPCAGAETNAPVGVVCVGVEMGGPFLRKSAPLDSQIAIIVNNHIAASTFKDPEWDAQLLDTYTHPDAVPLINGAHFVGLSGNFPSVAGSGKAGYLLLASYEKPLMEFRETQHALVLGSLSGIILGTAVVWLLVRRATRPLLQLRDTAEAVGRGDFSKRIEIKSGDELGELAAVFNQMTENLQKSLAQLEKTVEILRTTQAQLMHSEKLSAVGEFVAGVAHELNNPLTALIGYSELLQMGNVDADSRDSLKRISNSAERCHKIVHSLLSFARQHPPERKPTNIHTVIDAVLEILIYELRTSNIAAVREYAPGMPRLMVDPHQLQQVFLNIVNNARQAVEAHQPKGSIRVTTRVVGQWVEVRFQDDGPGIPPDTLAKIFNPFFTTKPVGKGTGLGLSLSYGIIQEHGGRIRAESEVGRGTTFIIELPVAAGSEAPPIEAATPPTATAEGEGAGRKILVVDDEADILDLVGQVLQRHGYQVRTALDGEKALVRLSEESFDLIVSDWKMPGMNGQQLYERLLETNRPAANRMIFMTGDVLSDKVERYLSEHGMTCLSKPFSLVDFRAALGRMFDKNN